jgi:hypothetical protein
MYKKAEKWGIISRWSKLAGTPHAHVINIDHLIDIDIKRELIKKTELIYGYKLTNTLMGF